MRLLTLIRHAYLRVMPPRPDPEDLTPDDVEQILDQGMEDLTGKPVDRHALHLNIAALKKRLAWLDRQTRSMLDTADRVECDPEAVAHELKLLRQEKATAQQRLTDLEHLLPTMN